MRQKYLLKLFPIFIIFSFLFILSCQNKIKNSNEFLKIKDDLGRELSFNNHPQRIISLAPNLTEILYSINCGDNVVGVTTYCNYPAEVLKKQKVADLVSVNYEVLLSLNPDLVVMTIEGNSKESFDKIVEMGLNVFVSNPRNLKGIVKTINDFAIITGTEEVAKEKINNILSQIDSLKKIRADKNQSALILVSIVPFMTAGENTYLNELLKMAGLNNITAKGPTNYPTLNREEVLVKDPDFILVPDDLIKNPEELLKVYPEWKVLKAYKNNRIKIINADLVQRPSSRIADALKEIVQKISE